MEIPKKLFLLDAMALIYRSYFAFSRNPRITTKGLNTSAEYGFTNTLIDVLKNEKPTHIAVVFDTPTPTQRHLDFKEYKANREAMPEEIKSSIPYVKKIIKGFNIPVISMDGYEADDIIGTLAKKAEASNFITFMMTPDKDFGQLVSENIFMFKPGRGGLKPEVLGESEVCQRFQIKRVNQVIDMLGMMGDSSDNIPGIPGVGKKTAQKLLSEFDTLEGVLKNVHKLKGKLKEKVNEGKDSALLSKQLATIILDVPVELNIEELKLTKPNQEVLNSLFKELEFKTIYRRLFREDFKKKYIQKGRRDKENISASKQINLFFNEEVNQEKTFNTIEDGKHKYKSLTESKERRELIQHLLKEKSVCFDIETTGLDIINSEIIGIAFSYKKREGFYVICPHNRKETQSLLEEFIPFFTNEKIEKIGQNIKYDIQILFSYGIQVKGPLFDTMLAHYILRPDMRHNMDILSETYLNYQPISIESLIGKKGKTQKNMRDVKIDKVTTYAVEDADVTYQLKEVFLPMLIDNESFELFSNIEMQLVPVLSKMEIDGIKLDVKVLNAFSEELTQDIFVIEKAIKKEVGVDFNLASPKQLGNVLFEYLKLDKKAKKTKTGQYATSENVLQKLAPKYSIVREILDWRSLKKLKSTYVDALPTLVNKKTEKIHTSYNQAVTVTGRLSSTNPNLQNIPIRTKKGREVRKAFVPSSSNHVLLAADYSQIELRLMAELSKDINMLDDFREGKDIHSATASRVYGVTLDNVTREMRSNAKMVNFGIIYGISAFGLSQRLGTSRKEAEEIINQYFEKYPFVKKYMSEIIDFARKNGYVKTIMGRKRILLDINSRNSVVQGHAERNAINAPIQGSAADIIKLAMININSSIEKRNLQSKMILQVHDELVFDVSKIELSTIQEIVKKEMENVIKTEVKLKVDIGIGNNWLDAH